MTLADDITNLKTRRAAICTEIAALDSTVAGGKPNANGEGGGIDHVGYKKSLYEELDMISARIKDALAEQAAEDALADGDGWTVEEQVS